MVRKVNNSNPILQDTRQYEIKTKPKKPQTAKLNYEKNALNKPEKSHKKYRYIQTDVLGNNPNYRTQIKKPNYGRIALRTIQERNKYNILPSGLKTYQVEEEKNSFRTMSLEKNLKKEIPRQRSIRKMTGPKLNTFSRIFPSESESTIEGNSNHNRTYTERTNSSKGICLRKGRMDHIHNIMNGMKRYDNEKEHITQKVNKMPYRAYIRNRFKD